MAIENDEELEEIIKERKQEKEQLQEQSQEHSVMLDESTYVAKSMQTEFAERMDAVKQNVLEEASESDEHFKKTIKENVKQAAVTLTEVEQKKADYTKQQVEYESTKLETKSQQEEHQQKEDIWENKQKCRQYHYNGVKPIMEFVGIKEPMNLVFLYLFTVVLLIPFFIKKFIRGTFGALIAGAEDEDRSKLAKGVIWTIFVIAILLILLGGIYLFLKWQGVDILQNIKS